MIKAMEIMALIPKAFNSENMWKVSSCMILVVSKWYNYIKFNPVIVIIAENHIRKRFDHLIDPNISTHFKSCLTGESRALYIL